MRVRRRASAFVEAVSASKSEEDVGDLKLSRKCTLTSTITITIVTGEGKWLWVYIWGLESGSPRLGYDGMGSGFNHGNERGSRRHGPSTRGAAA
jgi:hypothetical protein